MIRPVTGSFPPRPPWPPARPDRPNGPDQPQRPGEPGHPGPPGWPGHPAGPGWPPPSQPPRQNPALTPARFWPDAGDWPGRIYDRLLEHRIVMAHGWLDGETATRLSAQLLTLDAEGTQPIRLELHGLDAELPAALSVMGVLDTLRVPVSAYVGGRVSGPAVGVLAAAPHRYGYPSSLVVLTEPRMEFEGTVTSVASREQQAQTMLDDLFSRLARVTGREVDQVRADAQRQTVLTVPEAVAYGLLDGPAEPRQPPRGTMA